jgi:hypothetical protein
MHHDHLKGISPPLLTSLWAVHLRLDGELNHVCTAQLVSAVHRIRIKGEHLYTDSLLAFYNLAGYIHKPREILLSYV